MGGNKFAIGDSLYYAEKIGLHPQDIADHLGNDVWSKVVLELDHPVYRNTEFNTGVYYDQLLDNVKEITGR